MKIKVAITQMSCVDNYDVNVNKATEMVKKAAEAGANVILLQELFSGLYFCQVEDIYTFTGADSLTIAAGVNRHPAQQTLLAEVIDPRYYALWEQASDQSIEPEDGLLGVAVIVPEGENGCVTDDGLHGLCTRTVRSGEPFRYSFGSCWSKGGIKDAEQWFKLVKEQCHE